MSTAGNYPIEMNTATRAQELSKLLDVLGNAEMLLSTIPDPPDVPFREDITALFSTLKGRLQKWSDHERDRLK